MRLIEYVTTCLFLTLTRTSVFGGKKDRPSCAEVRRTFASDHIGPLRLVPYKAIKTEKLQICPTNLPTCCTRSMEKKYTKFSQRLISKMLEEKRKPIRKVYKDLLESFLDDFDERKKNIKMELLSKLNFTNIELNEMTSQDLKIVSFLDDVTITGDDKMIINNDKKLEKNIIRYFSHLLFANFHQGFVQRPNKKESNCISKEFTSKSVNKTIVKQLVSLTRKSTNITRTFLQGVRIGLQVLKTSFDSLIDDDCTRAFVKMEYCSHCYGLTLIKPCNNYCQNILNGCFSGFSEIDRFWQLYVTALSDVIERMIDENLHFSYFMSLLNDHADVITKQAINEETKKKVIQECRLSSIRHKRSNDDVDANDDIMKKQGRKSRRHHRRQRKPKLDLTSELNIDEDEKASSRQLILPPHEILFWESPIQPKNQKELKGNGYNRERFELESDASLLREGLVSSDSKYKLRRFTQQLTHLNQFFYNLPKAICEVNRESSIGISTDGSCWNGKNIVKNHTFSAQRNLEEKASPLKDVILLVIIKLKKVAKMLTLLSGKPIPDQLLNTTDDTIKLDGASSPCSDDEDLCNENSSGIDSDDASYKSVFLSKEKSEKKKRNKQQEKKMHPDRQNKNKVLLALTDFDHEVLLADTTTNIDPTLSSTNKINKNAENSSSSVFNQNSIIQAVSLQLTFVLFLIIFCT